MWALDPEAVRPWRCPRGDRCFPGHEIGPEDGGVLDEEDRWSLPGFMVGKTAVDGSMLVDGVFYHCPAHGMTACGPILDRWTICDGSVSELMALSPDASAAFIDAWSVIRHEIGLLRKELRRREAEKVRH